MEYIYAALLLHKSGKPVDEAGIKKVIEASGATIDECKMKSLIVSLKDLDIDKELENAIVASSAAPAAASGGETKAEEAPKEEKKEAAAAGLSALFG